MSLRFLDHGDHICTIDLQDALTSDHLPAEVYTLKYDDQRGKISFGRRNKRFIVPEVRYGKHQQRLAAIRSEYDRLNPAMGVLLDGLKGSGKSLFAEDMGNLLIDQGLPVLMVEDAIPAVVIRAALTMIGPCMCYFDEFGKVYCDSEKRDALLAVFSDTSLRGVLFVITGNDESEFTDAIFNRPGRFRYRLNFHDLPASAALEVAQHTMLAPHLTIGLARYASQYRIGYDLLRTVANVIRGAANDEEARERLEILNVPRWTYMAIDLVQITYQNRPTGFDKAMLADGHAKVTVWTGEAFDVQRTVEFEIVEQAEYYEGPVVVKQVDDFEIQYRFRSDAHRKNTIYSTTSKDRDDMMSHALRDHDLEQRRQQGRERYGKHLQGKREGRATEDAPTEDALGSTRVGRGLENIRGLVELATVELGSSNDPGKITDALDQALIGPGASGKTEMSSQALMFNFHNLHYKPKSATNGGKTNT